MKTSEDKCNELQVKSAFLQVELQNEKISNVAFRHRIDSLQKQCEDATASAASSLFSRFSQEEFKQLAIKRNEDHYELITKLFHSLNDIYETYIDFGQMAVVHEDHVEKRDKASKAYDEILDWKRYMKDKPENIIILGNF